MVRRKVKRSRRRDNSIRVLNVLESYMYANILSQGLAGTSPIGLVTGETDLGYSAKPSGIPSLDAISGGGVVGAGQISLGDMVAQPSLALATISDNFASNYQAMAIQSFVTRATFKFGKRLLRAPISNVNRNIMKPLGVGIKL